MSLLRWWRRHRHPAPPPQPATPAFSVVDLLKYEMQAEAAYHAMYDAPRAGAKDCYDDAMINLASAIEVADQLGHADVVSRLKARKEHVRKVYDSQFRRV